jgi:hypothetical protein
MNFFFLCGFTVFIHFVDFTKGAFLPCAGVEQTQVKSNCFALNNMPNRCFEFSLSKTRSFLSDILPKCLDASKKSRSLFQVFFKPFDLHVGEQRVDSLPSQLLPIPLFILQLEDCS